MRRHSRNIRKAWRPQVPLVIHVRNGVAIVYASALLVVACVSLFGIKAAGQTYIAAVAHHGADWLRASGWQIFPVLATCVAAIFLSVAYGIVLFRKGLNLAAPLFYLATLALIVADFFFVFTSALKDGRHPIFLVAVIGGLSLIPLISGAYGYFLNTRAFTPTLFNVRPPAVKPWW
jgi:hypothetical protein